MVVGLMAGVGLAFLLEYLDNSIKNEQDVEKHLDVPLLGVISIIEDPNVQKTKGKVKAIKAVGGEKQNAV
jgi:hypothetical protein